MERAAPKARTVGILPSGRKREFCIYPVAVA